MHRSKCHFPAHFDTRNIHQIPMGKYNASACSLLPQPCSSAGRRFVASRSRLDYTNQIVKFHKYVIDETLCKLDSSENPRSFEKYPTAHATGTTVKGHCSILLKCSVMCHDRHSLLRLECQTDDARTNKTLSTCTNSTHSKGLVQRLLTGVATFYQLAGGCPPS